MPTIKTAITVPADVLESVDRAARALGESRSKYITRVLRAAVRARRDVQITERLNELFAQEGVAQSQRDDAAFLDQVGSSFAEDGW